jgi:tetratricopeptide (TPR) repeat protein
MLAASAWIAQTKGENEEALKFMRAAADVEDNSEKHIAMENRLYPMRELLGDLLLEQQQPAQALTEYETALQSTPNRLRGLYGAAKAAEGARQPEKAAAYFRQLAELTNRRAATGFADGHHHFGASPRTGIEWHGRYQNRA